MVVIKNTIRPNKFLVVSLLTIILGLITFSIYQKITYMSFSEDVANNCTWENGRVIMQTQAAVSKYKNVYVRKQDVGSYLANAHRDGRCIGNSTYPLYE